MSHVFSLIHYSTKRGETKPVVIKPRTLLLLCTCLTPHPDLVRQDHLKLGGSETNKGLPVGTASRRGQVYSLVTKM